MMRRRVLLVVVPLALVLGIGPRLPPWPTPSWGAPPWPCLLAAAALYLAAHLFRALRLALLAATPLQISARTLLLLHFHCAPVSFALPFKLGELYRLLQLARLGRDPAGALLVLLLDRAFDAVILLMGLSAAIALGFGLPPGLAPLVGVLSLAIALGLIAVLAVPGLLEAVQHHILRHHADRASMRLLRWVDAARLTTGRANAIVRRSGVPILALSAGIWALETMVLLALALPLDPAARPPLAWLPTLPLAAAANAPLLAALYAAIGVWTLTLVWPAATWFYLRRAALGHRARPGKTPPARRARYIRLHRPAHHPGRLA